MDDASDTSIDNKNTPLRRSARRKTLAPLSSYLNQHPTHEDSISGKETKIKQKVKLNSGSKRVKDSGLQELLNKEEFEEKVSCDNPENFDTTCAVDNSSSESETKVNIFEAALYSPQQKKLRRSIRRQTFAVNKSGSLLALSSPSIDCKYPLVEESASKNTLSFPQNGDYSIGKEELYPTKKRRENPKQKKLRRSKRRQTFAVNNSGSLLANVASPPPSNNCKYPVKDSASENKLSSPQQVDFSIEKKDSSPLEVGLEKKSPQDNILDGLESGNCTGEIEKSRVDETSCCLFGESNSSGSVAIVDTSGLNDSSLHPPPPSPCHLTLGIERKRTLPLNTSTLDSSLSDGIPSQSPATDSKYSVDEVKISSNGDNLDEKTESHPSMTCVKKDPSQDQNFDDIEPDINVEMNNASDSETKLDDSTPLLPKQKIRRRSPRRQTLGIKKSGSRLIDTSTLDSSLSNDKTSPSPSIEANIVDKVNMSKKMPSFLNTADKAVENSKLCSPNAGMKEDPLQDQNSYDIESGNSVKKEHNSDSSSLSTPSYTFGEANSLSDSEAKIDEFKPLPSKEKILRRSTRRQTLGMKKCRSFLVNIPPLDSSLSNDKRESGSTNVTAEQQNGEYPVQKNNSYPSRVDKDENSSQDQIVDSVGSGVSVGKIDVLCAEESVLRTPQQKMLRRSKRRRTFAVEKGTLLLNSQFSPDSSFSSCITDASKPNFVSELNQKPTRRSRRKSTMTERYRDALLVGKLPKLSSINDQLQSVCMETESGTRVEDSYKLDQESSVNTNSVISSTSVRSELSSLGTSKSRRRRRSSFGLHVGGMITHNDIEAIERENTVRKKNRPRSKVSDQTGCVTLNEKKPHVLSGDVQLSTDSNGFDHSKFAASAKENNNSRLAQIPQAENVEWNQSETMSPYKNPLKQTSYSSSCFMDIKKKDEEIESIIPLAEEIKTCIIRNFNCNGVTEKPCMSARIFACLFLIVERQDLAQFKNGDHQSSVSRNLFQSLKPLLKALVTAELSSLGDREINKGGEKKRLHFCSFNYSSILTPVDLVVGSNEMIESCITALYNVLHEIKLLRLKVSSQENVQFLMTLLSNLRVFEDGGGQVAGECSNTMPFPWPLSRFSNAARYYRSELEGAVLGQSIANGHSELKNHLGCLIGSAIRFYLRRFFNTMPPIPSVASESKNQTDISKIRSRVHNIVAMGEECNGLFTTATGDGSIASILALALRRIHHFFEQNLSMKTTDNARKYATSFCQRNASKRGLKDGHKTIKLTIENLKEIMTDIEEGHIVLNGIRACKFVRELLNWPGVSEAITDIGGWTRVEYLAKMYVECELEYDSHDERHFMLLDNIEELMQKLDEDAKEMSKIEMMCEESLRKLWRRFRCGTRDKKVLRINPFIKDIQEHLKAGKQTHLPPLVPASEIE